jgi:Neprosin
MRSPVSVALLAAGVLGVLPSSGAAATRLAASAPAKDAARFVCAPRPAGTATPPPQPVLSPDAAARVAKAKALLEAHAMCADGQVPVLTAAAKHAAAADLARLQRTPDPGPAPGGGAIRSARGAQRPAAHARRRAPRARAARELHPSVGWYSYAIGSQEVPWQDGTFALFGQQSNEDPFIMYPQPCEHSDSQLWGRDNTPGAGSYSGEEIGWMVDQCRFGTQDLAPHLQVELHDAGVYRCHEQVCTGVPSGSGWHAATNVVQPGAVLTHNDTWHTYGIQNASGNWWYYYDGTWLGYYDPGVFSLYRNTGFTEIQAGGEVYSQQPFQSTCTDMGSFGPIRGDQGNAAMWLSVWRGFGATSQNASFTPYESDAAQYDTGFWSGGNQFRYGGGGWC